ncbi:MAG: hypothetical protein IPI60_06240 [Saprospiraceae bacterium]|nr:hypothetical protein [Saprospiraceae bacterium]
MNGLTAGSASTSHMRSQPQLLYYSSGLIRVLELAQLKCHNWMGGNSWDGPTNLDDAITG